MGHVQAVVTVDPGVVFYRRLFFGHGQFGQEETVQFSSGFPEIVEGLENDLGELPAFTGGKRIIQKFVGDAEVRRHRQFVVAASEDRTDGNAPVAHRQQVEGRPVSIVPGSQGDKRRVAGGGAAAEMAQQHAPALQRLPGSGIFFGPLTELAETLIVSGREYDADRGPAETELLPGGVHDHRGEQADAAALPDFALHPEPPVRIVPRQGSGFRFAVAECPQKQMDFDHRDLLFLYCGF